MREATLKPVLAPETMKIPVIAGAALLAFVFATAGFSSWTDIGTQRIEPASEVLGKTLMFDTHPDGTVVVTDIAKPDYRRVVSPKSDGFVHVAVSSLNRDRFLVGLSANGPFRLLRDTNGRTWLADPETKAHILTDAFGPPNSRSFAKLLSDGRTVP